MRLVHKLVHKCCITQSRERSSTCSGTLCMTPKHKHSVLLCDASSVTRLIPTRCVDVGRAKNSPSAASVPERPVPWHCGRWITQCSLPWKQTPPLSQDAAQAVREWPKRSSDLTADEVQLCSHPHSLVCVVVCVCVCVYVPCVCVRVCARLTCCCVCV